MEVVADSGAVYGIYDRTDAHHKAIAKFLKVHGPTILIPAPLLGEIGYMLAEWLGESALIQFLDDVRQGFFLIVDLTVDDLELTSWVLRKYSRLKLGLCDAVVIAVAERLGNPQILTVDQKHFRTVKRPGGGQFVLIPWDIS